MSDLTSEQWYELIKFTLLLFAAGMCVGMCAGLIIGMKISERLYARQIAAYEQLLLAKDTDHAD